MIYRGKYLPVIPETDRSVPGIPSGSLPYMQCTFSIMLAPGPTAECAW